MPQFNYKCIKCGHLHTLIRCGAQRDNSAKCPECGGRAKRNMVSEMKGDTELPYSKPVYSESMGVNPSQVAEHRQLYPDIPITDGGQVICKSHKERERIRKKLGFRDNDGYN